MKKGITLLLLMFTTTLTLSAQEVMSAKGTYDATLGVNLGVRNFDENIYEFRYQFNGNVFNESTQLTRRQLTPSFNFGGSYKVNKLLALGAIATYAQANYVTTANYDNSIIRDDRLKYFSIAPRIRFDWLNRKYVTLYSSLALGVGFTAKRDRESGKSTNETSCYAEATFIGIKAGRTLFGFADISATSSGAMRVGIGYNFK